MHLPDSLSSIISSSISTSSLILPKTITATTPTSINNNVMPYDEMSIELNNNPLPDFENNHLHRDDHTTAQELSEWTQKSITAISTFRTKSLSSSSSSTSSGCSSDFEQVHSPEEESQIHHDDNSPDSPDSGVSGSVNSVDDLKHMEEDEDEHIHLESCSSNQTTIESTVTEMQLNLYPSTLAKLNLSKEDKPKTLTSRGYSFSPDEIELGTHAVDTESIVIHMNVNAQTCPSKTSLVKPQFCCKWLDCDWPGEYEELAEHVREIHVEFQPFLDSHGKVIKWGKRISHQKVSTYDEDETPCNSDPDEESEEDDEEVASDDDSQSVSSASSCRVTRRSSRGQGLFHYSPNKSNSCKLRQNAGPGDEQTACDKQQSEQKYVCLWHGCRVFGKPSSSRQWLERHVLELHSGPKPFKCIVESCGQRFKSQNSLERHVNTHFRATNGEGISQRNSVDCCCQCCCHSCSHCDTSSTSTQQTSDGTDDADAVMPESRPDKNRCDSMDSGISMNPFSCSESSYDASSSSGPSKLTAPLSSQTTDNCHPSCCKQFDFEFDGMPKYKKKSHSLAIDISHFACKLKSIYILNIIQIC